MASADASANEPHAAGPGLSPGDLDFLAFDADNHYYEATDAFTRYIPREWETRGMQWVELRGKTRLMVDGRLNRFIPNPTFDPVARPGCLDEYFRGKQAGDDIRAAFGELEPIRPEYRDPRARLRAMDEQGLDKVFLFPTLAVGMEAFLQHDAELTHEVFHAFNRWLADDWPFAHEDRIFSAPYVSLLDAERAVAEVEWLLDRGARIVCLRSGPVNHPMGQRAPSDPGYDPLWARLAEAGVVVGYHSGESGYGFLPAQWGVTDEFRAFRYDGFKQIVTGHRPIHDTIADLVCNGVLTRHPGLRVATIESGSDWVVPLARALDKMFRQRPTEFGGADPVAQLRAQVWVSPYYEDDLIELREVLGADRVLFGSDWPHAEGLAEPLSYVKDLAGYSDDEIRLVMRDNALALSRPPA